MLVSWAAIQKSRASTHQPNQRSRGDPFLFFSLLERFAMCPYEAFRADLLATDDRRLRSAVAIFLSSVTSAPPHDSSSKSHRERPMYQLKLIPSREPYSSPNCIVHLYLVTIQRTMASLNHTEIELAHLPSTTAPAATASDRASIADIRSETEIEQAPLPPTDTGRDAWLALLGCTLIQVPVWGTLCAHILFITHS